MTSPTTIAHYVMIGGFLGAGKTTAIERFALEIQRRGQTAGLITNDQSSDLVDTTILRSRGFAVEEIPGGCFCCRFDSLRQAADRLTESAHPDVFLAEPVGSCTDLLATVSYPLRRMYGDRFRIAPLSVLVDPRRAARVLGIEDGRSFSPKVVYVYEKQLEEADLIVVNKCDAIPVSSRDLLAAALGERFPQARVLCVSAKDAVGLEPWFDAVLDAEGESRPTMPLDYEIYAEGEAQLGWLNTTVQVRAREPVDGNELIVRIAAEIGRCIDDRGGEIAHLKATLESSGQLSVVSIVDNESEPDLRESLLDAVPGGTLVLNVRAELAPEILSELVTAALAAESARSPGLEFTTEHAESFRPAPPVPTHRIVVSPTD